MNAIASMRPKGFVDHLSNHGIHSTVITHLWELENGNWKWHSGKDKYVHEEFAEYDVYRIPRVKTKYGIFQRLIARFWLTRQVQILVSWLFGYLDTTAQQYDSYRNFKSFVFKEIDLTQYDLVMGIFSPHHHLKLCYELNKKFGINYILDFRDLWDNNVMDKTYRPAILKKLQNKITQEYWTQWLNRSDAFFITSEPWRKRLASITNTCGYVVTNGYEADLYDGMKRLSNNNFTICHSGTIYPDQPIDLIFETTRNVINAGFDIRLKLVGVKPDMKGRIGELVKKFGLKEYVIIFPRLDRNVAIEHIKNSDLLYYPAWQRIPGWHSGKLFEYIASGNTVLVCPDDNSVASELIISTNTGFVTNNVEEMQAIVIKCFKEWENGSAAINPNQSEISKYSRETQTKILAGHIFQLTDSKDRFSKSDKGQINFQKEIIDARLL